MNGKILLFHFWFYDSQTIIAILNSLLCTKMRNCCNKNCFTAFHLELKLYSTIAFIHWQLSTLFPTYLYSYSHLQRLFAYLWYVNNASRDALSDHDDATCRVTSVTWSGNKFQLQLNSVGLLLHQLGVTYSSLDVFPDAWAASIRILRKISFENLTNRRQQCNNSLSDTAARYTVMDYRGPAICKTRLLAERFLRIAELFFREAKLRRRCYLDIRHRLHVILVVTRRKPYI